jgi:hypothetical protein
MKFVLVVEDTPKGIRCTAAYKPNDLLDNLEQSVAAKTVANWAQYLKELEGMGVLYVEKE